METAHTRPRRLDYLPLDEVPRATRNPRQHDLDGIREAFDEFGCTIAGLLDERTGTLVAGHGRLHVLQLLHDEGADPPEGVLIGTDGRWLAPIVRGWTSHSDPQAEAYIITDNRLTQRGGWDDRMLAEVLDDIADHNPDLLEVTGYSTQDLDDMIALLGIEPTPKDGSKSRELYGDPDDDAFAPEIRIKVTPEVFDRWRTALDRHPGRDDAAKLVRLLDEIDGGAGGWDGT